jgi:hypothetical protein
VLRHALVHEQVEGLERGTVGFGVIRRLGITDPRLGEAVARVRPRADRLGVRVEASNVCHAPRPNGRLAEKPRLHELHRAEQPLFFLGHG